MWHAAIEKNKPGRRRRPGISDIRWGTTMLAIILFALPLGCKSRVGDSSQSVETKEESLEKSQIAENAAQQENAQSSSGTPRPARNAGTWYSGSPDALRRDMANAFKGSKKDFDDEPILALIGPHAGFRFSGQVAAQTYARVNPDAVRRVFLFGPSHYHGFLGAALPPENMSAYYTPLGDLPIDRQAVEKLKGKPMFEGPPAAHIPEHSLEMHAIFIAERFPGAKIVPLVVGEFPDAKSIEKAADSLRPLLGPGDLVVVSSDFTHFGFNFNYTPFSDNIPERLEKLLDDATEPLLKADLAGFSKHLAKTADTICGREPIKLLLALLPEGSGGEEAARDFSGRMTANYSTSVTYEGLVFKNPKGWSVVGAEKSGVKSEAGRKSESLEPGEPVVLDLEAQRLALKMARQTMEHFLETRSLPDEKLLGVPGSGPFRETWSVFVTLKKHENLRGCIGHIFPVQDLWMDIRENAIAAAFRDPRFPAVTADELPELTVEVSVLTKPREISGPEEFIVGRHGIVLNAMGSRAVFLPQVAPEQGWDRETTLTFLSRKAGLPPNAWRSPSAKFEVFEAQVFGESSARP